MEQVLQAMKNAAQLTEYGRHKDKTPFMPAIDAMLESNLLLLPAAYQGHAITFIKYNGLWAKCDRGVNDLVSTVVVSEIGNPYLANKELYNKILYEHKTTQFVMHEVAEQLDLKTLITLPTRRQLSGNCSWANVETSVPTMLFMIET